MAIAIGSKIVMKLITIETMDNDLSFLKYHAASMMLVIDKR